MSIEINDTRIQLHRLILLELDQTLKTKGLSIPDSVVYNVWTYLFILPNVSNVVKVFFVEDVCQ